MWCVDRSGDRWQRNGWRNSVDQVPANLLLWDTLVGQLESLESRGLLVAFVHVRREVSDLLVVAMLSLTVNSPGVQSITSRRMASRSVLQ